MKTENKNSIINIKNTLTVMTISIYTYTERIKKSEPNFKIVFQVSK